MSHCRRCDEATVLNGHGYCEKCDPPTRSGGMSDTLKTLEQLTDYMNDNPAVFGWKSRCEALIDFAERLGAENAELNAEMSGAVRLCGKHAVNASEGLAASLATSIARLADSEQRLERENADLRKLVDELEWILQLLKAGKIRDYKYVCQQRSDCLCWDCQITRINAALEAAKGGK